MLSWLHAVSQEAELADPEDFYSDGVSKINIKKRYSSGLAQNEESQFSRTQPNFHICAHPSLLVGVVCRCLVFRSEVTTSCPKLHYSRQAVKSQVEMFKAMMATRVLAEIEREHI